MKNRSSPLASSVPVRITADTSRAAVPALARRRLLGWVGGLFVGGAGLSLAGCGGGGDAGVPGDQAGSGAGEPAPDSGSGSGIGSGGSSGGVLSDRDRRAAFASVSAKRAELRASLDDAALAQALAAHMATLPVYTETGFDLDTFTAWGRMVDGRAHAVFLDRSILPATPKPSSASARVHALSAPVELPGVSTARVMHAFGTGFEGQRAVREVGGMLTQVGWTVRAQAEGDASLSTLRAIQGDGFLYIHTHGGNWGRTDREVLSWPIRNWVETTPPKVYALTSSTRVTDATEADAQIADDLTNWRLIGDVSYDAVRLQVGRGGVTQARTLAKEGMTLAFSQSAVVAGPTGLEAV